MGVVRTEEFTVGEKRWVRVFYDNGTIIERLSDEENQPESDPPLTEAEQAVLQTAINTEYLLYLMESTI